MSVVEADGKYSSSRAEPQCMKQPYTLGIEQGSFVLPLRLPGAKT